MIQITPLIAEAASHLVFAESTGGPLIAVPLPFISDWWGCFDEEGEPDEDEDSHYEKACALEEELGIISVGEAGAGLLLGTPEMTAFHPLPDGGLLLRWVGAESAAGLLAAALSVEGSKPAKEQWSVPGGEVVLMDAAEDGRSEEPMEPVCRFELAAGTYSIEILDWTGQAQHPTGTTEEVMMQALRLRRC